MTTPDGLGYWCFDVRADGGTPNAVECVPARMT